MKTGSSVKAKSGRYSHLHIGLNTRIYFLLFVQKEEGLISWCTWHCLAGNQRWTVDEGLGKVTVGVKEGQNSLSCFGFLEGSCTIGCDSDEGSSFDR